MKKTVVTLTSIPSRIRYIQPTIDSILNQSYKVDNIELYIPIDYKKRSLGKVDEKFLPILFEVIFCDKDY